MNKSILKWILIAVGVFALIVIANALGIYGKN